MPKPKNNTSVNLHYKKQRILERVLINFDRRIANYFWEIVDIFAYKNRKIAELYEKSIRATVSSTLVAGTLEMLPEEPRRTALSVPYGNINK